MLVWYHEVLLYITTMTEGSAGVSLIFQTLHECYDLSSLKINVIWKYFTLLSLRYNYTQLHSNTVSHNDREDSQRTSVRSDSFTQDTILDLRR